ncbi:phytoene desaturase family protein [Rariglobus hedericola]|uniref:NAD(P)/FAD-dependent oxidoreductase n=1 Tax=Rariglobus hedericola TaxID=2597822 RepID=A0A556QNT1_9BACT|nr:NAD(P)/FAD-dependent oxidoreductase [Rariglobus hedericola]TSJ78294.1 NAD(P)/FAD-dependent oxidoreductase [Rariglobus hedericola]
MNTSTHYDVAIIGAGMSGLAAGIRLAHFGKKVCIFERHNVTGGLNSFYSIDGRKYDVGLHAMTNFVRAGVKGTPLTKLLRQLRIERDEFALCEQKRSRVAFGPRGEVSLTFTNDFTVFESEVARQFPAQIDGFRRLVALIRTYDDVSLGALPESARTVIRRHVTDPLLEDMLFCPVMYYGSATEHDMEFGQFVIMFKALFLEGFARPLDGVRVILRVLLDKYRAAGGERRMKCGVQKIITRDGYASALLLDDGTEVTATHVISTVGAPETEALLNSQLSSLNSQLSAPTGALSYTETITVLDREPSALGWGDDTIVFFNDSEKFTYARSEAQVDTRSGVICMPNNFDFGPDTHLPEGLFRCTCLASYDQWVNLPEDQYLADKARWYAEIQKSAQRFLPALPTPDALAKATLATDMFTPRTIIKYTGRLGGAIYGSPQKIRDGRTAIDNLYIAGTDQGFLGIIGAMLSGISMANFHILAGGK